MTAIVAALIFCFIIIGITEIIGLFLKIRPKVSKYKGISMVLLSISIFIIFACVLVYFTSKFEFINTVADELDHLNGSEFEALCRPFLEMLTGKEFELKGHSLEMKSVKASVDLIQDEDTKVIGQCGTDSNYFSSDKPEKDRKSKQQPGLQNYLSVE